MARVREYWSRPRAVSVTDALRRRVPWAVRRLEEARRNALHSFDAALQPARFVDMERVEHKLTEEEKAVLDLLVDTVVDQWLAETEGAWRR